ncbi:M23 family metallopeptidase [Arsenicicoccus sp. oral taxon 190]|uniref:M23 family metallopeptidase n=1 Tax=Arsenicicoccus sp. oral taxon 190 TaxID=1658671 RepID=UPI00067A1214|nr:M23 family metallopeptidase [Arsenicicoccus sp. oral taxon 190]AKT52141.1 peptidase [Arsenicicoccus sp. oral taxon 190]
MTAVDLAYPFTGRWLVQNSPADRVPSHGTSAFASSYAIDFVPLGEDSRTAPVRARTWVRPEPPVAFPGFGRRLLAPVDGVVLAASDAMPDHEAYRGLPSVVYAVTQGRRAAAGWGALAGNHVLMRTGAGVVVALCHLRGSSLVVRVGDRLRAGQPVGACGNSGNSTEPHVHVQAMDGPDPSRAGAVPITFGGSVPRSGRVVQAALPQP